MKTPYTYLIGWSQLNKWYYGVKYAKNCHPDQFWNSYFTSSLDVKVLREQFGEPNVIQIRKVFETRKNSDTSEDARLWEFKVLKRIKAVRKKEWINKSNGGVEWNTEGVIPANAFKSGKEHIFYGKPPWNKGMNLFKKKQKELKMRNFYQFIFEDFSSPNATQFIIKVNQPTKGKAGGSFTDVVMFYEHISASSFNLIRFSQSFLKDDVMTLMNNPYKNWRVLIFKASNGFEVFVWKSNIYHTIITKALDANKNLNKYPNLKYNFLYNEAQLLMKGEQIGPVWCFPLVIYDNFIYCNLPIEALNILNQQKDLSSLFKLSDNQIKDLVKNQQFHL